MDRGGIPREITRRWLEASWSPIPLRSSVWLLRDMKYLGVGPDGTCPWVVNYGGRERTTTKGTDMAGRDGDGMVRVDLEWTIEGRNGIKTGKLYGLHEQEVLGAKQSIKQRARRGDTITIREV